MQQPYEASWPSVPYLPFLCCVGVPQMRMLGRDMSRKCNLVFAGSTRTFVVLVASFFILDKPPSGLAQVSSANFDGSVGEEFPPETPPLRLLPPVPFDVTTITIHNTTVGLCGDEHFCSSRGCGSSPGTTDEMTVPLCYCDQACVFYKDCCYDFAESCGQQTPPNDTASNRLEIQLQSFSCVLPYNQATRYLLVSGCPAVDTQTTVLCENPDTSDALASMPCYGRGSGVHFRNIYCALCHGEDLADLVAWKILVDCTDPVQVEIAVGLLRSTISNLDQIEKDFDCVITVVAPGDDVGRIPTPRRCYTDVVRRCPIPQHALSDACDSYTALTVTDDESNQIFKNPHCALCNLPNGPDRIEFATNCENDLPTFFLNVPVDDSFLNPSFTFGSDLGLGTSGSASIPGVGGPFGPGGFPGLEGSLGPGGGLPGPIEPIGPPRPPPISVLFDFRSRSSLQIVQNENVLSTVEVQCPLNEVYDPFASRCRRLSCSKGYLLEGNECIPDFRSLDQSCGGNENGTDIVMEVTVGFGDSCEDDEETEGADLSGDVQLCLAEFLGLETMSLQATASPVVLINCTGETQYSFSVNVTGDTLLDLREVSQIFLPDLPFCRMLNIRKAWSVELRQQCANLQTEKCTGHWVNESGFSLPVQNGTTLLYINASESWYTLNHMIMRANFQRQKNSFEQYVDVQICAEKTLACPLVILNSSYFQDDDNNRQSIVYTPTGEIFSRDEYIRTESGKIGVCSSFESNGTRNGTDVAEFFDFSPPQQILSLVGNILSVVAAAITFITYCVFKELRKRISVAIMALVACLFLAQVLLLLSGSATSSPAACATVAAMGHFFWLSTVFWTGVLAFDLHQTFAYRSRIRRLHLDMRTLILQGCFAFGGPMLIVIPCLVIHLCDCTDILLSYGNENVCWIGDGYVNLVTFGAPIGLVVFINGVLFVFTIRGIRSTKKQTEAVLEADRTLLKAIRQDLVIYVKISSLMGFTWIFGFLAAFSDAVALWYIFIILNSCQGLLIFLSFTCNKKVWHLWSTLVCGGRRQRSSSQTPSSRAMLTGEHKRNQTTCSKL